MPTIVLIGAGSASFTRGLVADLIQDTTLGPWDLRLVDTDPQALKTALGLSQRLVQSKEATIKITASTDRRQVLPGADVVVTTIGVGGRRAWEADVFIPRRYGIYQPVGDTAMPGGISRAMRMIPALVAIARDVADLCPAALFINYSNPMTANCWAIRRATGVPVIGLCHGTFHVEGQLAAFIGAPPEQMTALYAGVNHLTFLYDLRWQGRDAWPLVRARLAQERGQSYDNHLLENLAPPDNAFAAAENPFSWSLFATYGAYPAVNDRHVVEFFPERFPQGQYYGKILGRDTFSFEGTIAGGDQGYAAMQAQASGQAPLDERFFARAAGEHEKLLDILRDLDTDGRRIYAVNLPNQGAVPNLPADAVLELPALATATGLRPFHLPDFPNPLAAIITRKLTAIQLTVEAALQADRGLFVEALLADGAIADADRARQLVDDLLQAHAQYIQW
ncbi:MAG: hypothetical protein GKR89_25320 [Candidatus Latescibacteria bacterium]|nr:hypothetical protein [Candidatus Latescibacterota bacterium]